MELGRKEVSPALVDPISFHVTMRPEISRFGKSVAEIFIEKLTDTVSAFVFFMEPCPLSF